MAKKQLKADPAMEKVRSIFQDSGLSLAELGKRMGYDEDTARQSAWQFMLSQDPRMSMLRKFADAMGMALDELTPKGKRVARKIEDELRKSGCQLKPQEFRDLLEEQKAATTPDWTIDDLVCHPPQASEFCDLIRTKTGCAGLTDFLILRTLMNVRRSH